MGSIRLSKTHGVNPHMTFCPNCGGQANEIVMTEAAKLYKCSCGQKHVGRPKGGRCGKCGRSDLTCLGEIPPETRLPATEPCEACKKRLAEVAEAIENGGIPWRCKDCGSQGAIKGEHPIAKEWRARHGGKLVGLEVGKEQCPVCGDQEKGDGPKE